MSRSLGLSWFTTFPPIFSSPELMSSRPAIMFSAVDLPQPDGPTKTMNSPSAMLRFRSLTASVPSGYRLTTCSSEMAAMVASAGLPLDRAGRQAGDDATLEDHDEDDDRDRDDDGGRRDRPDREGELGHAGEEAHRGRGRARVVRRCQRDGEQELVPAEHEHEDRRGGDAGQRQRRDYVHEDLPLRRPLAIYTLSAFSRSQGISRKNADSV